MCSREYENSYHRPAKKKKPARSSVRCTKQQASPQICFCFDLYSGLCVCLYIWRTFSVIPYFVVVIILCKLSNENRRKHGRKKKHNYNNQSSVEDQQARCVHMCVYLSTNFHHRRFNGFLLWTQFIVGFLTSIKIPNHIGDSCHMDSSNRLPAQ